MITETTPLTPALRAEIEGVLREAMTGEAGSVARAGAPAYLVHLDATRDGEALGALIDVVEYFQLDDDA